MSEVSEASNDTEFSEEDDCCVQEDKFLIFTTGSNTYSPHQIGELYCWFIFLILSSSLVHAFNIIKTLTGIKRIKPISFPQRMDPGLPFRERIANLNREHQPAHENPNDIPNLNAEGNDYDEVDHLIDLHGHIIGMGLSPDHRLGSIPSKVPLLRNLFSFNILLNFLSYGLGFFM